MGYQISSLDMGSFRTILDKPDAMHREKELKGAKGRVWIWSLIKDKIDKGLISALGGREFDPPLRNRRSAFRADFTF